jgi:hypothetical protein
MAAKPDEKKNEEVLQRQLKEAHEAIATLATGSRKKRRKGQKRTGTDAAMEREIAKAVQLYLWPSVKFLVDEPMLAAITGNLFDKMDLGEKDGKSGPELVLAKTIWVAKWKETVGQCYNTHRNYVQQQVHDLIRDAIKEGNHDPDWPNEKLAYQLALRQGMGDEEDGDGHMKDLMVKYWDKLLPCVAGGATRWSPSKRHYQTICAGVVTPGFPDSGPCVTASDEAYLVVLLENNYNKWVYMHKDLGSDKKKIAARRAAKDPKLEVPYTSNKVGQNKFGGWNAAGRARFSALKAEIITARGQAHVPALEAKILEMVRKENDRDEIDKKKAEKGKKSAAPAPPVAPVVLPDNMDEWE